MKDWRKNYLFSSLYKNYKFYFYNFFIKNYVFTFLFKVLLIYLVWLMMFHQILQNLKINLFITRFLGKMSALLGSCFQPNLEYVEIKNRSYLYLNEHPIVYIADACNGLDLVFLFFAYFVARGTLSKSLKFIFIGFVGIFLLNILRIVILTILNINFSDLVEFHHKFTFTFIVYFWIIIIWLFSEKNT